MLISVAVFLGTFSATIACEDTWTVWFNRDKPDSGDWETVRLLYKEHPTKMCEKPTGIECRTADGAPFRSTGEKVICGSQIGFICKLTDNGGSCSDYKVRFLCPDAHFKNCYKMKNGADYRGTVHITTSGKTCQKWTSQAPHAHSRTPDKYPGRGLGDNNFCRNPDNWERAWCYTTDPSKRWELCDIGSPQKLCETLLTNCYKMKNGADYRGTVHITTSGKTCQQWTSQTPHAHSRTPDKYPGRGLGDNNFCRNPDNWERAWCYTTDPSKRWELCDIGSPQKLCETLFTNCYKMKNGADYRGTVHITTSGKTCQQWTSQAPHAHSRTPAKYPGRGLGDHNFCRNPDNWERAWCYTMDPSKRWELCDIGSPQKHCDL